VGEVLGVKSLIQGDAAPIFSLMLFTLKPITGRL